VTQPDRHDSPWGTLADTERRVALDVLRFGPLARIDLARRLGLSTASLTRLTKPLVERNVLHERADVSTGTGGRPSQPLDIDVDREHFVGVKLAGGTAAGVLTDLRAGIVARDRVTLTSHEPAAVVAELSNLVARLRTGVDGVTAVGVGLGGRVRAYRHVTRAPFLGWHDIDLGDLLGAAVGAPVAVGNDLHALMEAERWFGEGREVRQFAVLTIGASVGGGLVVHDEVVSGPDADIGLLGHFPIDPLGPACPEGHRGCAHSLMSIEAVEAHAALALDRHVRYDEVLDLAAAGDRAASRIVATAARGLGTLIAAVANIALPERVVLTGEGIRLAEVGWDRIGEGIRAGRNPQASPVDVRVLPDDPHLWARGAASIAIQRTVLDDLGWSQARSRHG
jgi:predicted NBD/HSP70 family sugar kinase